MPSNLAPQQGTPRSEQELMARVLPAFLSADPAVISESCNLFLHAVTLGREGCLRG